MSCIINPPYLAKIISMHFVHTPSRICGLLSFLSFLFSVLGKFTSDLSDETAKDLRFSFFLNVLLFHFPRATLLSFLFIVEFCSIYKRICGSVCVCVCVSNEAKLNFLTSDIAYMSWNTCVLSKNFVFIEEKDKGHNRMNKKETKKRRLKAIRCIVQYFVSLFGGLTTALYCSYIQFQSSLVISKRLDIWIYYK